MIYVFVCRGIFMKKVLGVTMSLVLAGSLVGCSKPADKDSGKNDGDKKDAVVSFEPGKYIGVAEGHNG